MTGDRRKRRAARGTIHICSLRLPGLKNRPRGAWFRRNPHRIPSVVRRPWRTSPRSDGWSSLHQRRENQWFSPRSGSVRCFRKARRSRWRCGFSPHPARPVYSMSGHRPHRSDFPSPASRKTDSCGSRNNRRPNARRKMRFSKIDRSYPRTPVRNSGTIRSGGFVRGCDAPRHPPHLCRTTPACP